mgnify:CR=1 FL=1
MNLDDTLQSIQAFKVNQSQKMETAGATKTVNLQAGIGG